jgi:hypothetical protein
MLGCITAIRIAATQTAAIVRTVFFAAAVLLVPPAVKADNQLAGLANFCGPACHSSGATKLALSTALLPVSIGLADDGFFLDCWLRTFTSSPGNSSLTYSKAA